MSYPRLPYKLILALVLSSCFSIGLVSARVISSDSTRYVFLVWNLILAIVPLWLGWWLVLRVRTFGWLTITQMILTIIWLGFLPNAFYLTSDFVHLHETYEASLIFDVVLLASFAINGLIFGFMSVFLIHQELVKRVSFKKAYALVMLILLACSFATYLGRYTRWNSWDLLFKPTGLLFDVSDRFINPSAHYETYLSTLLFFGLLSTTYFVIWEVARELRGKS